MKEVGKKLLSGLIFGMAFPVGVILTFHVFYLVGKTMLFFGINQ